MPELNPVAVTSADFLRAIESGEWTTKSELAELAGRQRNNMARDLKIVADAGLVKIDPDKSPREGIVLTDHAREQLAAIARAEHGGEKRKTRGRWPADRIVRNPANRVPRDADVAALADTIEAAEDVLQDVLLTPPDANGVRMLLAGEHRWRAVRLLAEQDRLPAALAEGLPFRERQATAAEQILIRIVENTARADLSPLEDARQLLALQRETGWSAREIAKKTGRSPADSDTGVRDVQVKIKVAKEAAPEAVAEYERTGSWDALRDSVTEKKPRPAPEQELSQALAESGPAVLGGGARPQQALEAVEPSGPELTRLQSLALAELYEAGGRHRRDLVRISDPNSPSLEELERRKLVVVYRDAENRFHQAVVHIMGQDWLTARGLTVSGPNQSIASIRESLGFPAKYGATGPSSWATPWLRPLPAVEPPADDPLVVNGRRYPNLARANEARRAAGILPRQANSGGHGKPRQPLEAPAKSPPETALADPGIVIVDQAPADAAAVRSHAAAIAAAQPDPWGRTSDQITADEAQLQGVRDLVGNGFVAGGLADVEAFHALGVVAAAPSGGGGWIELLDRDGKVAGTVVVDVDNELSDERAQALTILIARAVSRVVAPAERAT